MAAQIACDDMRKAHGNCSMIWDQSCSGHNNRGFECSSNRYEQRKCTGNGYNAGNFYLCKEPVKVKETQNSCIYFRGTSFLRYKLCINFILRQNRIKSNTLYLF